MPEASASADYKTSTHFRLRLLKDRLARHGVAAGGIGVIVTILLIFFYLLYVVIPLMAGPEMRPVASYRLETGAPVLHLAMEEQAEVGVVFDREGGVRFLSTDDGRLLQRVQLPVAEDVSVVSFAAARPGSGVVALGLSNGHALVVRHRYRVSFPNDVRLITPEIEFPLGRETIALTADGAPLRRLAVQEEEAYTLVGWSPGGLLSVVRAQPEQSLFAEEGAYTFERSSGYTDLREIRALLVDPAQRNLYAVSADGVLAWFDISNISKARLVEQLAVSAPEARVLSARLLAGGNSILVLTDDGVVSQWFSVRDAQGLDHMTRIRTFEHLETARELVPEFSRKGFLTAGADGSVALLHATAHRFLARDSIADGAITQLAVAPRANALWALDQTGALHFWRIRNEHPEVSWSALWSKVWYEGYDEPAYIWQSSAANNDFEPKLSLVPLTFGTLKAAFYAMLFAIPLAILGAIYTAYFMAPRMRRVVKPTVEIMEALPTVILGFLAGLWLAPLVEANLPGLLALLLLTPFTVLLAAWLWSRLPSALRHRVPEGWEAALLVPVIVAAGILALKLGPLLEHALFGGNMIGWLENDLGIGFDQRNSLVVGVAMGFAVIPTIFSIAEDAIFSVPKHLSNGSLALGATPWQTLVRVVLLTASPGIFSGVMMGTGRAVGETMIVLMATGNTPVMDLNIFQGMRTLSANIAVEMPESEVGSTHYRVLFLAALVLFVFTFVFNTGAEIIRQRLRGKYSSL
ncbi:MAG: ABC transporter permease subunit [Gammaproteobacteria bacterium]|jgi:phosphate transport system permease protein